MRDWRIVVMTRRQFYVACLIFHVSVPVLIFLGYIISKYVLIVFPDVITSLFWILFLPLILSRVDFLLWNYSWHKRYVEEEILQNKVEVSDISAIKYYIHFFVLYPFMVIGFCLLSYFILATSYINLHGVYISDGYKWFLAYPCWMYYGIVYMNRKFYHPSYKTFVQRNT